MDIQELLQKPNVRINIIGDGLHPGECVQELMYEKIIGMLGI